MPELSSVEPFANESVDPPVRGFLHRSHVPSKGGLVLTHGAGGNAQGPMLIAFTNAFAEAGFTVLRCDLPYRQRRSYGPPGPGDAARDRAGLKHAVEAMQKLASGRLFLGGHSYGGRQATMLCADEPQLVNGLLLSSYPLHPPGKPTQLRVEHFHRLNVRGLFVQGTRDAFATIDEITSALRLIPAKTDLLIVEGVGHDLGFRGKARNSELAGNVLAKFLALFP